jgi:hypothetical protein
VRRFSLLEALIMKLRYILLLPIAAVVAAVAIAERPQVAYRLPADFSSYVLQAPLSEAAASSVAEAAPQAELAAAGLLAERRRELYQISPEVVVVVGQRNGLYEAVLVRVRSAQVVERIAFDGEPYDNIGVVGQTIVKKIPLSENQPELVAVGLVTDLYVLRLLVVSGDKLLYKGPATRIGEAMIQETRRGAVVGDVALPRLLRADVNGDGFFDVVLWTRNYSTEKASAAKCKGRSMGFVDESVQVALFDPQTSRLSAFLKRPDLSPPDTSLFYPWAAQEPGRPDQWPYEEALVMSALCPPLTGR